MSPLASHLHPPCVACAAHPAADAPVPDRFDDFRALADPAELAAFAIVPTAVRHEIDVADVLADYHFPRNVPCSLHAHPHATGYVVRTRCGLTLALGGTCGRRLIQGFGRVERHVADAREYQRFAPAMRDALAETRARLVAAVAQQHALFGFRAMVAREVPALADFFRRRFAERARVSAAEVPPGVDLWDYAQREADREAGALRRLDLSVPAWLAAPPTLPAQRAIRAELAMVQARLAAFLDWADRAARFVTREGFGRAVELHDSDVRQVATTVFDARTGQTIERPEPRLVRVQEHYRVTDAGLEDLVRDRTIPIDWP